MAPGGFLPSATAKHQGQVSSGEFIANSSSPPANLGPAHIGFGPGKRSHQPSDGKIIVHEALGESRAFIPTYEPAYVLGNAVATGIRNNGDLYFRPQERKEDRLHWQKLCVSLIIG